MFIKRLCLTVILLSGLFHSQLCPTITSRIQGTVVDKDSGQAITDAEMVLVVDHDKIWEARQKYKGRWSVDFVVRTDYKGFFNFNNLPGGEYYICIFKDGYEYYGPERKDPAWIAKKKRRRQLFHTKLNMGGISPDIKGRIFLKEGEVKHIDFKLGKEAVLEIKYIKKMPGKTEPLSSFNGSNGTHPYIFGNFGSDFKLENVVPVFKIYPNRKEKGLEVYENLPGGQNISVKVWATGYPGKTYYVTLENGKTTVINHVLDYTVGPVLHGTVSDNATGLPIEMGDVYVFNDDKGGASTSVDFKGEFWLKGFRAGKLKVLVRVKGKSDVFYLDMKENEIKEINLQY